MVAAPVKKEPFYKALPWLSGTLILIIGFVLWPTLELFLMSFRAVDISGLIEGWAGLENYRALIANIDLPPVLRRTVIWLVVVVGIT